MRPDRGRSAWCGCRVRRGVRPRGQCPARRFGTAGACRPRTSGRGDVRAAAVLARSEEGEVLPARRRVALQHRLRAERLAVCVADEFGGHDVAAGDRGVAGEGELRRTWGAGAAPGVTVAVRERACRTPSRGPAPASPLRPSLPVRALPVRALPGSARYGRTRPSRRTRRAPRHSLPFPARRRHATATRPQSGQRPRGRPRAGLPRTSEDTAQHPARRERTDGRPVEHRCGTRRQQALRPEPDRPAEPPHRLVERGPPYRR